MIDSEKLASILKVCREHGVDYIESEGVTIRFSPVALSLPMEQSGKVIPDIQSYSNLRDYDSLHGIPSIDEDSLS